MQSVGQECLDHFICFGEQHLRYVLPSYLEHSHLERPYQSKSNVPLTGDVPEKETATIRLRDV